MHFSYLKSLVTDLTVLSLLHTKYGGVEANVCHLVLDAYGLCSIMHTPSSPPSPPQNSYLFLTGAC